LPPVIRRARRFLARHGLLGTRGGAAQWNYFAIRPQQLQQNFLRQRGKPNVLSNPSVGAIHTNTIEGFWSHFKRSIFGETIKGF
jgi:hypothetical protein